VGELGLEHVEAELALRGLVAARGYELERSTWMPVRVTQVLPRTSAAFQDAGAGCRSRTRAAMLSMRPCAVSRPEAPKKSIAWMSVSFCSSLAS
jgi:hypothetical protein